MKSPNIPEEARQLLDKVIVGYSGTYKILEFIGGGGTSYVFKSRIENTVGENPINPITTRNIGRIVACKILLARLVDQKDHYSRFQNEVKIAKRLAHLNIIEVYDAGEVDGRPFMIMDYVDLSLSDIYAAEGKLAIHTALPIFLQISAAFSYAHQRDVIHRDLKPSNVMLARGASGHNVVKIVDFGIAKIISETTSGATQLTQTGDVFGTPTYMSPEQCRAEKIDSRSDIYSMGVLMYEMLAGHLPLKGHDALSTMSKHTSEVPKRFDDIDPDSILAKKMEKIIFKCLEKKPNDRYQKMDELERELELVRLYSDQARAGKTNKILCAIERAWLFQSQLIRKIFKPVLSKRIRSSEITVGAVLFIASTVLILAAVLFWIFLFGLPFSDISVANRELPFKPIIDTSVKVTDDKLAEAVWTKLQTSSVHTDAQFLEQISELFLRVAESYKKTGNYEAASWWYYRRLMLIDSWLKQGKSMAGICAKNAYAEICLLENTIWPAPNRTQNEQLKALLKKHGKFIPVQVLRETGLTYAEQAATARDSASSALSSLATLTITQPHDSNPNAQKLLAQGLLAESLLELGDIDDAKASYDQFYETISKTNLCSELDTLQCTYLLALGGRFYLQQNEHAKAFALLDQVPHNLSQLDSLPQYDLAVIYNDIGLIKEGEGNAKEAQTFFSQSYGFLTNWPQSTNRDKSLVLNNLSMSSLKAGDFKAALQYKLKTFATPSA